MTKQTRNPQETQSRILKAALEEFSAHGFHGARVDRIVKAAEVNKRMVYHYFDDKEGLFKALMKKELDKIYQVSKDEPTDSLLDMSLHWLENIDKTKDYFKLYLSAESLMNSGEIALDDEHNDNFSYSIDVYTKLLKDKDVDPKFFLLAMLSITSIPILLPKMTEIITGKKSDSQDFKDEYAKVISYLLK
jgi:AcrR family transcriptional regulator